MSEEKYWIIPSVCTYRDFTEENFDESIGDKFFTMRKNEQKIDDNTAKENDEVCKRQKSTTSLDSGVEDKEPPERYSTESDSSNSEQSSSNGLRKSYRKQSTEELLVRLNEIKKQNEAIEVKPKPKLQLKNFKTSNTLDCYKSIDTNVSLESNIHPQRMSRISAGQRNAIQFKNTVNTPVLLPKRSYSTEKVPVLKKIKVVRSTSLKNSNTKIPQPFNCKFPPSVRTTPVAVAKSLSSKISCFFSSRRSERTASEPPKLNRKSENNVDTQVCDVKVNRTNTILGNRYSNELKKGRLSKGKIVNIIERLSKILLIMLTNIIIGYKNDTVVKCPLNVVVEEKCSKRIHNLFTKFFSTHQIKNILDISIRPIFNNSISRGEVIRDIIIYFKSSINQYQYQTGMLAYVYLSKKMGPLKTMELFKNTISITIENMRNLTGRKLVYEGYGEPLKVVKFQTTNIDENLVDDQIIVKWVACPINPADINQIQGVYPVKPTLPAIPGNEGCGIVIKTNEKEKNLKEGDLVIPRVSGLGTWRDYAVHKSSDVFKINKGFNIDDGATLQVNPPTAYRMLHDFVPLEKGDFVIQNGANSAVGRFLIQFCRIYGYKSINIVRDRDDINELKKELKDLGGDYIFTEQEFTTEGRKFSKCKLALNCVGGKSSLMLGRSLDHNGVLVTYGGMSKQPVQCLTGPFIFKNISLKGFWMSQWYNILENEDKRHKMYDDIYEMYKSGDLKNVKLQGSSLENYETTLKNIQSTKIKQIFRNDN
uniref:Enoyl-[acyl-carrier-protein] reductase, mitochondrial n=1 Tax=Strongyloides stercoralis TaxID=6248 RepID=A0AAF5HXK5_STRER